MSRPITHREMTLDEVGMVLDWAGDEGWNPGLDDAAAFHATDPVGFFLAEVAGRPAAAISVVNHSPAFAFLGLYICRPEFRGQGIGLALWHAAMAHAGHRTVGLDGVPDQQENYRKSGFVRAGETRRFAGCHAGALCPDIRSVRADERKLLAALEARATGAEKPAYLGAWLTDCATRRTVVLDLGGVRGFATCRECLDGVKVGPLVARTPAEAVVLLDHIAAMVHPRRIIVDLPDTAEALSAACRRRNMTVSFTTARMYKGTAPTGAAREYAVTTLELG